MKRLKIAKVSLAVFLLIIFLSPLSTIQADEIMDEIRALKQRIEMLEQKLKEQDNKIETQDQKIEDQTAHLAEIEGVKDALGNLEIYIGATGVIQGSVNNDDNYKRVPGLPREGDGTDGSYSVDIEISSPIGKNGRALLFLEAGEGDNIVDEAGGLTGANADALGDSVDVEVAEVWYEHNFFNNRAVLTVGKLDATRFFDNNVVANDETTQFLADIFVNNIAMDWPDYAGGMRFSVYPTPWLDINTGVIEADGSWEDIFDDNFSIVECNFKPIIVGKLPGNYRLYYWWNNQDHAKLTSPLEEERGQGFGLSIDQQISENVTIFGRFARQYNSVSFSDRSIDFKSDIYPVKRSWSLGAQIAGSLWDRPEDVFGFAYGQAELSDDFENLLRLDGFNPGDEGRFEAYYRYQLNEHLAITPDLQVVHDLQGVSSANTVTIFGVRGQLDF